LATKSHHRRTSRHASATIRIETAAATKNDTSPLAETCSSGKSNNSLFGSVGIDCPIHFVAPIKKYEAKNPSGNRKESI
jgi:hypothetical protein